MNSFRSPKNKQILITRDNPFESCNSVNSKPNSSQISMDSNTPHQKDIATNRDVYNSKDSLQLSFELKQKKFTLSLNCVLTAVDHYKLMPST